MEHQVILEMWKHKGFSERWLNWVKSILSSGTSAVLLNRVPGKPCILGGVRQGDPLSPLLFVLAADLLQSMMNKAFQIGMLSLPIECGLTQDYPIIQHADDTSLIMPADELFCLKGFLHTFAASTGLKVNFQKSFLVPINVPEEKTQTLVGTLGCQIFWYAFYLFGVALGDN